jgi:ankyrin repeat protein
VLTTSRFLLAKFQLDHVLSYLEPNKRKKALKTVPKDIFTAYHEVIERIENSYGGHNQELASKIFSWLFYARRPLLMNELLHALAVDSEGSNSDSEEEEDGDDDNESQKCKNDDNLLQPEQVIEVCRGLVVYDESSGLVRFVHYTVQEFIAQHLKQWLQTSYLAKTCVDYLASFHEPCSSLESIKSRSEKYKFSRYAAGFWGVHAREAEDQEVVQRAVLEFLSSDGRMNSMVQLGSMYQTFNYWTDLHPTILQIIAKNGLAATCRLLLSERLNLPHTYVTRYIQLTNRNRDWLHFLQLPKKETDIATHDENGNTVLHYAAWAGHHEVVEVLIAAKVDVLVQNNDGSTALHHAAEKGRGKVVEILLAAKAKVDARNNDGQTALYQSARGGHDKIVELLLGAEANVEMRDNDGRTALQWAAWNGHDKVVKLLVSKANVDAPGDRGWTALHFTAWHGYDIVAEILLAANANVDARDNDGRTALYWAAWNGHDIVVKLLAVKAGMNT